ncbi:hypothetical protein GCM10022239_19090 [Leifsonia bigeumensis]|uniref:Primosomal protein n=1 Tax=Leifsonella bigeumensis TaxID=433643 RepID=A0ABP7FP80_9MICO
MADTPDRPRRPGGPPKGKRPGSAHPAKGAPARGKSASSGDRPQRAGDKPSWRKREEGASGRPKRDGQQRGGQPREGHQGDFPKRDAQRGGDRKRDGERRLWTRDGKPARGDASARERETPEDRDPYGTKSVRSRHDAPVIPEDVVPNQLDRVARAQLKTLSKENADEVARHLVMAARLIAEDPELAHRHAVSAGRRAGRIAVVRETLAITAYATGDYALALRELRTYRRISGRDDQLPMMVDSERGLGRPEKALELGRSVPRASLPVEVQVELAIAMSGARLDLGQVDAALVELQIPQLTPDTAFSWSPALFDAYATVLEDLGRADEAQLWFTRSDLATAALSSSDDADDLEIEVFEEEIEDEAEDEAESDTERLDD